MIHIKPVTYPHSKLKICQWCNKYFIYNHNREMYCTPSCRLEGTREQRRIRDKKYYNNHKDIINRKTKGTGWLGAQAHDDFDSEYYAIQKEMRRLRIRA